ncbi:hypothetical protein [Streptomyces sp. NPDC088915]|uniref:hypothetical protein n=1 Tax=Streptomyces sp. NPDC088915 TaxID=3365912 RepID=UPI003821070D
MTAAQNPAPAPNPPEPTTGTCPVLPLAPLGDPGDAVRRVTLDPHDTTCFTVTVAEPGLHQLLLGSGSPSLALSSGGVPVACYGLDSGPCELAAGTYTLTVTTDAHALDTRLSMVPLGTDTGCAEPVDTAFDTPPVTGTSPGALGIVCHPFTAEAGELVTSSFLNSSFANDSTWITDGTGKHFCTGGYACVLRPGTGGYRFLVRSDAPVAYTLRIRQLSHPSGCADVSVTPYGSAPVVVSPPTECKTFTPAATGPYEMWSLDGAGISQRVDVYGPAGRVCEYTDACTLTAGVTYTLVTGGTVRILDRSSSAGCEDVSLGRPRHGALSAPGETDCLNLPLPRGARVAVLTGSSGDGATAGVRVLDGAGALLCWTRETLVPGTCVLDGPAPYRAVVARESGAATGPYGIVVHRTDVPSACRTFPAGDFGADPARADVSLDEDAFADCLTIPADDHSARELMTLAHTAGSGYLDVSVLDEKGKWICGSGEAVNDSASPLDCALTPGLSHTVLLQGRFGPDAHTLVRRDVTGTARGCVDSPATPVGAPSRGGVPTGPGALVCHRVTTADARDTLHLNARYTAAGTASGFKVYGANGKAACGDFGSGCAVSGSTAYQAVVEVVHGDAAAPAYRLDAFRVGTAAGPAPECVRVPDVTYGAGPLTATLTEQRPALCAVLPTASNDWFNLTFTPAQSVSKTPGAWLYDGTTRRNVCSTRTGGYYSCVVPGEDTYGQVARPTTLVIGLPSLPSRAPAEVSAKVVCTSFCGTVSRAVTAVGPGTVGAARITMKVTGAALHEKDVVEVAGGSYRARSTLVSLAPDRRTMEVSLDLTGAPRAALGLSVLTHDGVRYSRGTVTVVAPLRATTAPAVTGTAVVGGRVTASAGSWSPSGASYAYQWRADGIAVAGATAAAYTLPASLQGRQLSVAVTARAAGQPTVTSVSAATVVKGTAPKATKAPAVSGTVRVGSKVTAVVGTWSPAPTSYAYQWRANGVAIAGATAAAYTLPASVVGKKLTVTVTAHRTGHLSGSAASAGYTVATGLAPKATKAPSLTGTVKVGRTLTLNRGTWTPAPTSYAYQWYANGRAISGATKTAFTPSRAQRGLRITVRVTALRTGHASGTAWTPATGAVAG